MNPTAPEVYTDGDFTTPFQHGPVQRHFPFKSNPSPDVYAREFDLTYWIKPANYADNQAIATRTSYTNLLTYSEAFDNGAWTKADATVSADSLANPADGLVTTDSLLEAATTAIHDAYHGYASVSGTTFVFSVCVKENGRTWVRLQIDDGTATMGVAFFNLSTGAVGTVVIGTATITPLGNGFYRCTVAGVSAHTATGNVHCVPSTDGSTVSYAGDITKGLYLWGAQVEAAASAGPYIPTTSVARTISAPNPYTATVDPEAVGDPFAFLMDETDPVPAGANQELYTFKRTYARIPKDQTTISTQTITKPQVSQYGDAVNLQLVTGSGTSQNLGANYAYLGSFWDVYNSRVFGPYVTVTSVASGGNSRVTWTAHGLAGTERIAIATNALAGTWYEFSTGQYSVIDANTIDLTGWSSLGSTLTAAGKYFRAYVPGTARVRTQRTTSFSLPGVSVGITTGADIPVPASAINDIIFLGLVAAYASGFKDYDADPLRQWLTQGYQQTTIQLDMATI